MRIRSPSLPELHAFVQAAATGSLTRAADVLCVTQGAVSRAVLRLESRLGVTLLERNAQGVQPTKLGRLYLEQIQPALAALELAVGVTHTTLKRRTLNICAIPTLNTRWLVPRLASFQAAHPDVNLVFKPYVTDEDFMRDDVDCWIQTRRSASSRWPRHVQATYIIGREIIPVCHPSVAAQIRTPADLLQFPLLHHVNYPDNWALWFQAAGVSARELNLGAGFDLVANLTEAAAVGLGVAVVQRCLIERELQAGRLVTPLNLCANTRRGYYLCVSRARAEVPAINAFAEWLLREAGSQA